MRRIFVQMVSYRDSECHPTIVDLFANARHPQRVFVGLCWQDDVEMPPLPPSCAQQLRMVSYPAEEARGAGWARCEAQKLWAGEEYILQIQAHHRFEPGWDDTLIELLEGLPTRKAILTAWLPHYMPPDQKQVAPGQIPITTVNFLGKIDDPQILHLIGIYRPQERITKPFLTGLWVGNFMFTHAQTLEDVPFDPHIYFWGEELNYSARLWTHGYDIYHLDRVVLYHYWDRKDAKGADLYRSYAQQRNKESLVRNLHILGLEPARDDLLLVDVERYSLGTARSFSDYMAFIGVDITREQIALHARLGDFAREHARTDLEAIAKKPRILVAIASYRDEETQHTVAHLFAQASYPDRIHVAVCHQLHESEDAHCLFVPERIRQVRLQQVDIRESQGANWARAQAMAHYAGEEYILQIDSHMRFEKGWDEILIEMLARCPSQQAVISAYVPQYTPPDKRDYAPYYLLRIRVNFLGKGNDPQLVHLTAEYVHKHSPRARLARSPFVIHNFIFARAEIWQKVPIDPHIRFYGDEITLSARLWTHGVDIYQPDRLVLYHLWVRSAQQRGHQHWRTDTAVSQTVCRRVRRLLDLNQLELPLADDTLALADLDRYGLGNVRPVSEFWNFAGVDIDAGLLTDKASKGLWE